MPPFPYGPQSCVRVANNGDSKLEVSHPGAEASGFQASSTVALVVVVVATKI